MLNWDAVGAIGENVGSGVVLISLIYIAIQVRDTKTATERASRTERSNALSRTMLETPQLATIVAKVNAVDGSNSFVTEMCSTYGLTLAESELYFRYVSTNWRQLETDFLTMKDEDYVAIPVRVQLNIPSSRRFFEIQNRGFDNLFVDYVDKLTSGLDGRAN